MHKYQTTPKSILCVYDEGFVNIFFFKNEQTKHITKLNAFVECVYLCIIKYNIKTYK